METDLCVENETISEDFYSNLMDKDNFVDEFLLVGTPYPVTAILIIYLLVVLKLGPMYMKGKSPYKLELLMRLYNMLQICYNSIYIYQFLRPHTKENIFPLLFIYKVSCSIPSDFEGIAELKYKFLIGSWHYFVLKLLDLFDTVFMILRHKESHVTFLHVYHHVAMVFFSWVTVKYIKATQAAFPVFLNVLVHAIMYSYYFLATFESLKKYLWWKHHLTKLQLAQFVIILGYILTLYYYKCPMSKLFTYIWIFNVFLIMCLFVNFYVKSYIMKSVNSDTQLKENKEL